jgi:hypothetical protein
VTLEMRADMWVDGEHVAAEEHVLRMSVYFTHELVSLLELAEFTDVTLRSDYTDDEPSPDTDFVVFIARKPLNSRSSLVLPWPLEASSLARPGFPRSRPVSVHLSPFRITADE